MLISFLFLFYPAIYFIVFPALFHSNFIFISFLPRYLFHFCLELFIITCLWQYLLYFISPWDYLSFLAQGDIFGISFLPRAVYHSLPRAIFLVFHSSPGLFHWLPRVIFLVFHSSPGLFHCLPRVIFLVFHSFPG